MFSTNASELWINIIVDSRDQNECVVSFYKHEICRKLNMNAARGFCFHDTQTHMYTHERFGFINQTFRNKLSYNACECYKKGNDTVIYSYDH